MLGLVGLHHRGYLELTYLYYGSQSPPFPETLQQECGLAEEWGQRGDAFGQPPALCPAFLGGFPTAY